MSDFSDFSRCLLTTDYLLHGVDDKSLTACVARYDSTQNFQWTPHIPEAPRYFIAQDDDGHWYLIPVTLREVWEDWRGLESTDPRAWEAPAGCDLIDGPQHLTFEAPNA